MHELKEGTYQIFKEQSNADCIIINLVICYFGGKLRSYIPTCTKLHMYKKISLTILILHYFNKNASHTAIDSAVTLKQLSLSRISFIDVPSEN